MTSLSHIDPISPVIFWVTLIFLFSTLGRYIARYFDQPGVLGELIMGVVFGNVCYFLGIQLIDVIREGSAIYEIMKSLLQDQTLSSSIAHCSLSKEASLRLFSTLSGPDGLDYLKVGYVLDIFSRYGVIFLLFLVGVESSLSELKHTGKSALWVACVGVMMPLIFGFATAAYFLPSLSLPSDLFIGATLCATSVGVTARVLKELHYLRTREANIILGAAMIDDILGLLLLAVVCGVVVSGRVNLSQIMQLAVTSLLFFAATLSLGPYLLKKIILSLKHFEPWEAKLITSFLFVMIFAWLATRVDLAAIIGAFTAGLIIHDQYFDEGKNERKKSIRDLVSPLEAILAPLFFMLIGMQVKLETFFDWKILSLSAGLVGVAIVSKLFSGWMANQKEDRLLIGIGMIPRGEVGLIFASIGKSMGVLSDEVFSAVVLMVMVTTMITPPLMKWRIKRLAAVAP